MCILILHPLPDTHRQPIYVKHKKEKSSEWFVIAGFFMRFMRPISLQNPEIVV